MKVIPDNIPNDISPLQEGCSYAEESLESKPIYIAQRLIDLVGKNVYAELYDSEQSYVGLLSLKDGSFYVGTSGPFTNIKYVRET